MNYTFKFVKENCNCGNLSDTMIQVAINKTIDMANGKPVFTSDIQNTINKIIDYDKTLEGPDR